MAALVEGGGVSGETDLLFELLDWRRIWRDVAVRDVGCCRQDQDVVGG
jgi:hypothetical protein